MSAKINAARRAKRAANIGCGKGVVLRVSASGVCTFLARAKQPNGKNTNILIGNYPKMTLSTAREKAQKIIKESKEKIIKTDDPISPLFGDFVDERLELIRTRGKNDKRFLTVRAFREVLRPLDAYRLEEITPQQVISVIRGANCSDGKKYNTAKFISQMYNEALRIGLAKYNPFLYLTREFTKPPTEGFTWVPLADLNNQFWQPLIRVPDFIKYSYLLIALTGLRLGSATALKWEWVNFDNHIITIPGEFMKMGAAFRFPITSHLEKLLNNFIRDFGQPSKYVLFHWSPYDFRINLNEPLPFRHLQAPVTANCHGTCTIHGLRKTLRTWLAENGVPYDVAEKCLSHEEKSAVVRAYLKYDFLAERAEAMEMWGRALAETLPPGYKELLITD